MEKKEISIYWLLDKIITKKHTDSELNYIFQQAKALHKKEILIAYSKALPITDGVFTAIDKAHDYYNEQFGGNHE